MADDLAASRLGTKEHWDAVYDRELGVFDDSGDPGEVWFEETVGTKLADWVVEDVVEALGGPDGWRVLDVGTGNGVFVVQLVERGVAAVTGSDYSAKSIALARRAAAAAAEEDEDSVDLGEVEWVVDDMLATSLAAGAFDLVHDKGTFDAIALAPDSGPAKAAYKESVMKLLKPKPDGAFVITSCNFTRDELELFFAPELEVRDELEYPVFRFGGSEGRSVTTLLLQRGSA